MTKTPFSEKMIDILNYGAINLAVAIGYRTGLFDVMDSLNRLLTSDDLSDRAGLNRRYVKEWLGIMSTAGIVELFTSEDGENRYFLPYFGDLVSFKGGRM